MILDKAHDGGVIARAHVKMEVAQQALGTCRAHDHIRLRSCDRMDNATPRPTSVYLYYDRHEILIYAGITSRGIRRQAEHNADKDWWPFVARQEVEHFDTRREALAREKALIVKHCPPFNRQHNPDHEKIRASYLIFAASHSQPATLIDELRALKKQIPLDLHARASDERLGLRTRLEHSLIARALRMPDGEQPKVLGVQRKKKGAARVQRIDRVGPLAVLRVSQRIDHPIKTATLSVTHDAKQQVLWVKSVQVVLDHSDSSLCNPRCPVPRTRWIRPDGQGAA